jgi:hypothetical protein
MMPTNLAILAAYVRRQGHDVRILDYQARPFVEKEFMSATTAP